MCLGQHLEPVGINISFSMKTLTRAISGTIISFGPGFLQITQLAWLLEILGIESVTDVGLCIDVTLGILCGFGLSQSECLVVSLVYI
jgi:hypothetical protein